VVEGAQASTLRKRRRDAPTTSLPVCIHVTSKALYRGHLSAPSTKLRVAKHLRQRAAMSELSHTRKNSE
jgi:hypothetical protein